jgi:hypothetical protein
MEYDEERNERKERMDEAVLALPWMNSFVEKASNIEAWRGWKGVQWEATDRLYEKKLISDGEQGEVVSAYRRGTSSRTSLIEALFVAECSRAGR